MQSISREEGKQLFKHYHRNRDGIRLSPQMASVCLICESIHLAPNPDNPNMLVCCNCGFAFYRYVCPACGLTIDGRDPQNPGCPDCGLRICTCGKCGCSDRLTEESP